LFSLQSNKIFGKFNHFFNLFSLLFFRDHYYFIFKFA
jgi:hypothetical protein